jgi:hypothetical protein
MKNRDRRLNTTTSRTTPQVGHGRCQFNDRCGTNMLIGGLLIETVRYPDDTDRSRADLFESLSRSLPSSRNFADGNAAMSSLS